jgi:hypothetical protein
MPGPSMVLAPLQPQDLPRRAAHSGTSPGMNVALLQAEVDGESFGLASAIHSRLEPGTSPQ